MVLAESEQVNDGLWKYYLANLEIDLLIFEDFYLLDPSSDAHILEDVDGYVDYRRLTRLVGSQVHSG
jgi:hypothetical protein